MSMMMEEQIERIQDAINASEDRDSIYVHSGSYNELINVIKSVDIIGEHKHMTVIDCKWRGEPVRIWSSNVTFQGFTVMNGINDGFSSGINILGNNIRVTDCIIYENDCGIRITETDRIQIDNYTIHNNYAHSIYSIRSSNVTIQQCTIYENGCKEESYSYGGIFVSNDPGLDPLYDINIHHNLIYDNALDGISIGSGWGHFAYGRVTITNNQIFNNSDSGIFIWTSEVMIHHNLIFNNGGNSHWDGGITLKDCVDVVTIESNHLENNRPNGVYLLHSSDNVVKMNNFINHRRNAGFSLNGFTGEGSLSNTWMGNYWDDQMNPWIKVLFGEFNKLGFIPFLDFDLHPANIPYDLSTQTII